VIIRYPKKVSNLLATRLLTTLYADLAIQTAKYYSLRHERVVFTPEDAARHLKETVYHAELPFINAQCVAKFCLSKFARDKGFVVSLTGEGSDELFLGYAPFRMDTLLEMRSRGGEYVQKVEHLLEIARKKEANGASIFLGQLPEDTPK
jgi:asparagine synthase (glutamine-hydrolysing)